MASRRRRPPRVALLVETTHTYTRELLAGVRRYVAAHGPWSCFIELRALESGPPPWLKNWDGDGILTRTFTQEMADVIAATGLPAVELRATYLKSPLPFVGMDNRLIGGEDGFRFAAGIAGAAPGQAMISFTTSPYTSVSRKSRPRCRWVSLV